VRNIVGRLLVVLAFGWAGGTNATLMDPVDVDGTPWLQPIDFLGATWNDIVQVCDPITGVCDGSFNGNDLTGWTWASEELRPPMAGPGRLGIW
jgi:hypothetical protein